MAGSYRNTSRRRSSNGRLPILFLQAHRKKPGLGYMDELPLRIEPPNFEVPYVGECQAFPNRTAPELASALASALRFLTQ